MNILTSFVYFTEYLHYTNSTRTSGNPSQGSYTLKDFHFIDANNKLLML